MNWVLTRRADAASSTVRSCSKPPASGGLPATRTAVPRSCFVRAAMEPLQCYGWTCESERGPGFNSRRPSLVGAPCTRSVTGNSRAESAAANVWGRLPSRRDGRWTGGGSVDVEAGVVQPVLEETCVTHRSLLAGKTGGRPAIIRATELGRRRVRNGSPRRAGSAREFRMRGALELVQAQRDLAPGLCGDVERINPATGLVQSRLRAFEQGRSHTQGGLTYWPPNGVARWRISIRGRQASARRPERRCSRSPRP